MKIINEIKNIKQYVIKLLTEYSHLRDGGIKDCELMLKNQKN